MVIIRLFILFLLIVPLATAQSFNSSLDVKITNNTITINTEGEDFTLTIPTSGELSETKTFNFQRELTQDNLIVSIEEKIKANAVNQTSIENICDHIVDEGFASQQSWITETFMPQTEQMNNLKSENEISKREIDLCKSNIKELTEMAGFERNQTQQQIQSQKETISLLSYCIGSFVLLIILAIGLWAWERFKE